MLILSLFAAVAFVDAKVISFSYDEISAPFLDKFETLDAWTPSEAVKESLQGQEVPEDLLRYSGQWALETAREHPLEGDLGLVAKTPAAHHVIFYC